MHIDRQLQRDDPSPIAADSDTYVLVCLFVSTTDFLSLYSEMSSVRHSLRCTKSTGCTASSTAIEHASSEMTIMISCNCIHEQIHSNSMSNYTLPLPALDREHELVHSDLDELARDRLA